MRGVAPLLGCLACAAAFVPLPTPSRCLSCSSNHAGAAPSAGLCPGSASSMRAAGAAAPRPSLLPLCAKKGRKAKGKLIDSLMDDDEDLTLTTSPPAEQEQSGTFDKSRLAAEITTPWRTLRLFIYGAFATSALIGGFTAVTQLAASVAGQPDALPLTQCLTNVGIDFGVVAACVFGFRFESSQQKGLEEAKRKERDAVQQAKANQIPEDVTRSRVQRLQDLAIRLQVSEEEARNVPVGVLMKEGKQNFVVVAGGKEWLQDAMLRAQVNRQIYQSTTLQVVPVQVADPDDPTLAVSDKGFGAKPAYLKQSFVGEPADEDAWRAWVAEELRDADRQGNAKAAKQGIVLVFNSEGKVLRRGLGMPKWEMIRQDLYPDAKTDDMGRRLD